VVKKGPSEISPDGAQDGDLPRQGGDGKAGYLYGRFNKDLPNARTDHRQDIG